MSCNCIRPFRPFVCGFLFTYQTHACGFKLLTFYFHGKAPRDDRQPNTDDWQSDTETDKELVRWEKQAKANRLLINALMEHEQKNDPVDDVITRFNQEFEQELALEQSLRGVPGNKRGQQSQSASLVGKPYYYPMPERYPYTLGEEVLLTAKGKQGGEPPLTHVGIRGNKRGQQSQSMSLQEKPYDFPMPKGFMFNLGELVLETTKGEQGNTHPLRIEGQSRPENSQSSHFTHSLSANNEIQQHQLTRSQHLATGSATDDIFNQFPLSRSVHNTGEMERGNSGSHTSGISDLQSEDITATSREAQIGALKLEDSKNAK